MSTFSSFARRCATGLVATQMLLGAVSVTALTAPAHAAPAAFTLPLAPQAPAAGTPSPFAPQAPASQAPVVAAPQAPAPAAPAAAVPQDISFLDQHGAWQGFSTVVNGETVGGAMTRMSKGGVAAFMVNKNGDLLLLLADPSWKLKDGMTVPVRLTIDGQVYTLTATAQGNVLLMPRVTKEVLQSFVGGSEAQFDAGNGAVVWTLALDGFVPSMKDAIHVIEA